GRSGIARFVLALVPHQAHTNRVLYKLPVVADSSAEAADDVGHRSPPSTAAARWQDFLPDSFSVKESLPERLLSEETVSHRNPPTSAGTRWKDFLVDSFSVKESDWEQMMSWEVVPPRHRRG